MVDIVYKLEAFNEISFNHPEFISSGSANTRIIYAKTSPFTVISEETEYRLSTGEAMIIPPFCNISICNQQGKDDLFSLISYFLSEDHFYAPENNAPIKFDEKSEFAKSVGKYFSLPLILSFKEELLKKSIEYYIIYLVNAFIEEKACRLPEKMLPIISFIENNYGQNFSTADIAKASNISESAIYKLFTAHLKESPKQYIRKRRMHHAINLLINSKKTISDIAIETGFYDQFYFSKEFKKEFGVSPSCYRKEKTIDK